LSFADVYKASHINGRSISLLLVACTSPVAKRKSTRKKGVKHERKNKTMKEGKLERKRGKEETEVEGAEEKKEMKGERK